MERCTDCRVKSDSLKPCQCGACELCEDCINKADVAKGCESCDCLLCKDSCLTYSVRNGLVCGAATWGGDYMDNFDDYDKKAGCGTIYCIEDCFDGEGSPMMHNCRCGSFSLCSSCIEKNNGNEDVAFCHKCQ
jgi:hypothetical protein